MRNLSSGKHTCMQPYATVRIATVEPVGKQLKQTQETHNRAVQVRKSKELREKIVMMHSLSGARHPNPRRDLRTAFHSDEVNHREPYMIQPKSKFKNLPYL